MDSLGTERAFEVLAQARALEAEGREIVHLEIGEPDVDTPSHIVEAAVEALRQGYTHYGPTPGLPERRDCIARHTSRTRDIPVHKSHIRVADSEGVGQHLLMGQEWQHYHHVKPSATIVTASLMKEVQHGKFG